MSYRKQRSCCLWLYKYSKRCFYNYASGKGMSSYILWSKPFFSLFAFLKCSSRPDFAAAWMNLGIVQNSLKQFEAAEQSYRTAIKHRRKYPDCYYNLGRLVSVWWPLDAKKSLGFFFLYNKTMVVTPLLVLSIIWKVLSHRFISFEISRLISSYFTFKDLIKEQSNLN